MLEDIGEDLDDEEMDTKEEEKVNMKANYRLSANDACIIYYI